MNKETYKKMTGFLHSHPTQAKIVITTNKIITYAIYLAYPCFLLWLVFHNGAATLLEGRIDPLLSKAILVPAVSFIAVSLLRALLNAPRPYEVFALPPVIAKDTKGKSFPSRHAFSIFVIGVTFLAACPLPLVGWLGLSCSGTRTCWRAFSPRCCSGCFARHCLRLSWILDRIKQHSWQHAKFCHRQHPTAKRI